MQTTCGLVHISSAASGSMGWTSFHRSHRISPNHRTLKVVLGQNMTRDWRSSPHRRARLSTGLPYSAPGRSLDDTPP